MLWEAGQERLARERRSRMADAYATTRDALIAADLAVGRVKAKGAHQAPWYVNDAPPATAASQRTTLNRLAAMIPGAVVRRRDS